MSESIVGAAGTERIPFQIKVLRKANPIMIWLLGSRLHALLSRELLVLRYRGRKSGRRFSTPLSYVEIDGRLYLFTRRTAANWWRNLVNAAPVEIVWRGQRVAAEGRVLDHASEEAEIGFRRFLIQNPGTASSLYQIDVGRGGRLVDDDVRREIKQSIVVRVEPDSRLSATASQRQ